jgi:RecA/RadA recombinase
MEMVRMKMTGNHPVCNRVITKCYSLDHAFINHVGSVGVPVGVSWEIYGAKGIGKSSLAYSLAGMIAKSQTSNIIISDFEGYDERYIEMLLQSVGFDNEVRSIRDKEDEKQLMASLDLLSDPKQNFNVMVLDSISAITPVGEQGGELGERNMGQRAFAMAQFARRGLHIHRFFENKTILALNHWIPDMTSGSKYKYISPGGNVKNYLMTVLIHLKRVKEFPEGSYILEGIVDKNRWGFSDRHFNLFMISGVGLHLGMTAVWDCITYKLAEYNTTISIDTQKIGKISTLVKAAKDGQEDIFQPFISKLESIHADIEDIGTENEGNEPSEMDEISD